MRDRCFGSWLIMAVTVDLDVYRCVLSRDNKYTRASHLSLYMTRVLPYGNAVAGSAIGSLGYERWVAGRRPKALCTGVHSGPERVKRDLPNPGTLVRQASVVVLLFFCIIV